MGAIANISTRSKAVSHVGPIPSGPPLNTRLFPATPNWKGRFEVELSYKTDIFRSRAGYEQRRSLRDTPRKRMSFRSLTTKRETRNLNDHLLAWSSNLFSVPDPTQTANLAEDMPAGAVSVALGGLVPWDGVGTVLLLSHGDLRGFRTLLAADLNRVYFSDTDSVSWPSGTTISTAIIGRVQPATQLRHLTDSTAEGSFSIDADPLTDAPPTDDFKVQTWRGYEVLKKKPNWSSPVDYQVLRTDDVIDFDRGPIVFFDPEGVRRQQISATFLAKSRDEIREIECFFRRMKGMRGSFFAPTWKDDLRLAGPITPGGRAILVEGHLTAELMIGDAAHRSIVLVTNSGDLIPNNIVGGSLIGNDSLLSLSNPLPADLHASDVRMVCWFPRFRCASDNLVLTYHTDGVAEARLVFTSLKESGGIDLIASVHFDGETLVEISWRRGRARVATFAVEANLNVSYRAGKMRAVQFEADSGVLAEHVVTRRRSVFMSATAIMSVAGRFERIAEFTATSMLSAHGKRARRRSVVIEAVSDMSVRFNVSYVWTAQFTATAELTVSVRKSISRAVTFNVESSVSAKFARGFDDGFDAGFR